MKSAARVWCVGATLVSIGCVQEYEENDPGATEAAPSAEEPAYDPEVQGTEQALRFNVVYDDHSCDTFRDKIDDAMLEAFHNLWDSRFFECLKNAVLSYTDSYPEEIYRAMTADVATLVAAALPTTPKRRRRGPRTAAGPLLPVVDTARASSRSCPGSRGRFPRSCPPLAA